MCSSIARFFPVFCLLLPAFAAQQDALAIESVILARHLPYGAILDPVLSPDLSLVVSYSRCGDSAIWTGHYLAAEAFRYKVTGSPEALTNVNNTIQAIRNLIDVTGTDLLARCALPADSPYVAGISSEEAQHGVYKGSIYGAPWIWVGDTSRDSYSGVFFGLAAAYDLVNDQGVRNWVSFLVTRMVGYLQDNFWNVVMPDGSISTTFLARPDQQLTLLLVGRHVNGGKFGGDYSAASNALSPTVPIPVGIDCANETSSYFKFNLDYINFYTLLRLGSGYSGFWYNLAYDELRSTTDGHANAFFNMIDRAVGGPDRQRDAETRSLMDAWLQRPRIDVFRDYSLAFPVCGDNACKPLPVQYRVTTDFVWQRSPFQLAGGGDGNIETAGIDYILPYWMGRYYGVITN